jgi:hypothetical protein
MRVLRDAIVSRPVTIDSQTSAAAEAGRPPNPQSASDSRPSAVRAPAVAAPTALRPGISYYAKLAPAEERATTEILTAQVAKLPVSSAPVSFPGVIRQLTQDNREVQLKTYALVGEALTYDSQRRQFVGTIKLGVSDLFDQAEGRALSAPIRFDVLESALADPTFVVLKTTSPPHEEIKIHAANPSNPLIVRVASRFNQEGISLSLPLNPTLFIQTDRQAIQGYGLETTRVLVSIVGHPAPKGLVVQLTANPSAHFELSQLTLGDGGTAETILRSDATGHVSLTATGAGGAPGTATVDFEPPARTLISATIGGLLGGLLRMFTRARANTKLKHRVSALAVSILTGLFVFLLYVVGVNVFPIEILVRVSDVFVLAVSALGAWVGTAALRQFQPSRA